MNRLFIHHLLFRLLSPIFSGIVIYLLILLIQNDVEQLQEDFLGDELYICIGLSYIVQELSRGMLILFQKFVNVHTFKIILFQVFASMALCIGVITLSISQYYKHVIGFSVNSEILWLFNSIFCCITLIYILMHLSHHYLYKINTQKMNAEQLLKQNVEDDFVQFKKGINTDLLFESFEALIVLIRQNKGNTDDFIDHIATVYRYILSRKKRQLVSITEELEVLKELVQLFNYLPHRNITLSANLTAGFLIVPGSLLAIVEQIVRCSINAVNYPLKVTINETNDLMLIQYEYNDKIVRQFKIILLEDIEQVYKIYTDIAITIKDSGQMRSISIPKLKTSE